jgi:hypothetical protein
VLDQRRFEHLFKGGPAEPVRDAVLSYRTADGGVPLALPSLEPYPHAPWWSTAPEGSLVATARSLAVLLRTGIEHPFIARASGFCWAAIDASEVPNPYEAEAAVVFLDAAPDRERAEAAAERIGRLVRERGFVGGEFGGQPGEVHAETDFAPRPDTLARRWFSDAEMDRALDRLQTQQEDGGGWRVKWIDGPTPATAGEWAEVTLNALLTLRAYGRL